LSTIVVGVIGITACRFRKCPLTLTYGILSFVSFLVFLVTGGVILSSAIAIRKQIDSKCTGGEGETLTGWFGKYF
jgi:hypothetical protein